VKALDAARQLGNIKVLNIVMLGIMAKSTDIPVEIWHEAIRETVKEKFVELNIKAFDKGYQNL
jgi:indolepyruvate ferredoxin oxidoreductase beta subunit